MYLKYFDSRVFVLLLKILLAVFCILDSTPGRGQKKEEKYTVKYVLQTTSRNLKSSVQMYSFKQVLTLRSTGFYPNVTTLRSGRCCRNSVCLSVWRLSSVTLVHPTQVVEPFGKISSPLHVYAGHPLTSVQNFTEIVLGEPLRRER